MESKSCSKSENQEKIRKKNLVKTSKFMKNKSKYNLINTISYILNNLNPFGDELSKDDFKIIFQSDSDRSNIDSINYLIELNNKSFNPKRDTINNNSKYKDLKDLKNSMQLSDDEYYGNIQSISIEKINLFPKIQKGLNLNMSCFPFYYYNKEKKEIEKFIFNNKIKKNVLIIYSVENTIQNMDEFKRTIDDLDDIQFFWDFFDCIYFIYQLKKKDQIYNMVKNSNYFYDKNKPDKIKHIFNLVSSYEDKTNTEIPMNIFYRDKHDGDYFFIIDKENNVVKYKEINNMLRIIEIFIKKEKNKQKNNNNTNNTTDIELKENDELIEIFKFINNIKKLNYIFLMSFRFNVEAYLSKNTDDIYIKKINSLRINGEFRTKEYNLLQKLFKKFEHSNKIKLIIKELPTIDIDIDFTNMKCLKCSNEIPNNKEFYYCYICKTKYCYECIQQQLKQKGKKKFIDQKHNLLFLKTRNKELLKNLDKSKLGSNKFAESTNDNQFDNKHNASCNGCGSDFKNSARYICFNCRPGRLMSGGFVDFCGECIDKMCKNENERINIEERTHETVYCRDNNFISGHKIEITHNHENHVYMMIAAQYNQVSATYYDF